MTAWNNRLAILAEIGALIEIPQGRANAPDVRGALSGPAALPGHRRIVLRAVRAQAPLHGLSHQIQSEGRRGGEGGGRRRLGAALQPDLEQVEGHGGPDRARPDAADAGEPHPGARARHPAPGLRRQPLLLQGRHRRPSAALHRPPGRALPVARPGGARRPQRRDRREGAGPGPGELLGAQGERGQGRLSPADAAGPDRQLHRLQHHPQGPGAAPGLRRCALPQGDVAGDQPGGAERGAVVRARQAGPGDAARRALRHRRG